VLDIPTARELFKLPLSGEAYRTVLFAGTERLVSADKQRTIAVWDARTGKLLREIDHGGPATILAVSDDGRWLATHKEHENPNNRWVEQDRVQLWDLSTGQRLHTLTSLPKRWYAEAKFSPDGKRLFALGESWEAVPATIIWDVETGQEFGTMHSRIVAISPDGRFLARGRDKFDVLDQQTGHVVPEGNRDARVHSIFLSADGERVFTAGYSSFDSWEVATGRHLRDVEVPQNDSSSPRPCQSADGRYALSYEGASKQLQIHVWDVFAGKRLYTLRPPGVHQQIACAFSEDAKLLAMHIPANTREGKAFVRIWDVRSGQEIRAFPEDKAARLERLFFTSDDKILLLAGDKMVGYETATGNELFFYQLAPEKVNSVLGVASAGGKIFTDDDRRAWSQIAASPDGAMFACLMSPGLAGKAVPDRIRLFEARTGSLVRRWNDSGKMPRWEECLRLSPDSRLLASSESYVVHVWEVATGNAVITLEGHRGDVGSLAFSGNGRRLASASLDSTCIIWDLPLATGTGSPRQAKANKEIVSQGADLASEDARRAYVAVWRLAEVPEQSMAFLSQHLRPATAAQVKEIQQYVADLDSRSLSARKNAFEQLQALGIVAAPALREAAKQHLSLETHRRVEHSWKVCAIDRHRANHSVPCGPWRSWNTLAPQPPASCCKRLPPARPPLTSPARPRRP
jgi:WD40 repeat protein